MASYNRVIIIGNLTRDPEHKQLSSGQGVCRLSLASNRQFKNRQTGDLIQEVCYIDVDVWGAQAESCRQNLQKGRGILVEGRLKYDSWQDQSGQTRSKISIVADRVIFLGPNAQQEVGDETKVGTDDSSRFDIPTEMERDLLEQVERLKNREFGNKVAPATTPPLRKKKSNTEEEGRGSSINDISSGLPADFNFKDEPPFKDDLPF